MVGTLRFAHPCYGPLGDITWKVRSELISNTAQKKVRRNHGNRLAKRAVSPTIAVEPSRKGGILAALRRSPLIGADLDLTRSREINRKAPAQ